GIGLWLIGERGSRALWRLVALGLVVQLHRVAVGIAEAIGRTVAEIAVDPLADMARRFQGRRATPQRLRADGAPSDVPEASGGRLRELERRTVEVAPRA